MKNFKKYSALFLSAFTASTLLFGGCSDEQDDKKDADLSKTFLTVGDEEISLEVGRFYALNQQASYEAYYLANGYSIDWNSTSSETNGKTLQEAVKDDVLEHIKIFYTIAQYAKENGITLDDSDYEDIDKLIEEYFSSSENGLDNLINATNITKDFLKKVYEVEAYYNKGCDYILKDETFDPQSDDIRVADLYAIEITEDTHDFPEDTAKAIVERINNGEKPEDVAKIYGLQAIEGNLAKGDFNGDPFEVLGLSLQAGECNYVNVDGESVVIYCVSPYDEEASQDNLNYIKTQKIKAFYDEYSKNVNYKLDEDLWATINYNTSIFTEDDLNKIISDQISTIETTSQDQ